jgi:hypothetical protein
LVLEADGTGLFRNSAGENDGQNRAEFRYSVAGDRITLVLEGEDGSILWEIEGRIQRRRLVFKDAVWEKR